MKSWIGWLYGGLTIQSFDTSGRWASNFLTLASELSLCNPYPLPHFIAENNKDELLFVSKEVLTPKIESIESWSIYKGQYPPKGLRPSLSSHDMQSRKVCHSRSLLSIHTFDSKFVHLYCCRHRYRRQLFLFR